MKKSDVYKDRDYKHAHAAFTAQILNEGYFNLGDIAEIAAGHHAPKSDEEWAVACGDRMASAFEREIFEDYNSADSEDFKSQRLWHLFDEKRQFAIDVLSPETIFAKDEKAISNEYDALWRKFEDDMQKVSKAGSISIDSFTIEYLLRKYCSFIPSSTSFSNGKYKAVKANIPLFEHSKATAIFSCAIQKLIEKNDLNVVNYYKHEGGDIEKRDFLYINGDFFGIQKFIFDSVPSAKASKILRARSAYIQILTKIVAIDIVKRVGLHEQSIISTHAGKFEILATNDEATKEELARIQKELDDFFVDRFFGESGIGISFIEASLADFILDGRYKDRLRRELAEAVEAKKYSKFDLMSRDPILAYDDGINNENLCPLCSKRKKVDDEACWVCRGFITIGEKLAKSKFMKIIKGHL